MMNHSHQLGEKEAEAEAEDQMSAHQIDYKKFDKDNDDD